MADLNSAFEAAAARYADRPAARMDGLVLSYSQVRDAAYRMASLLSSAGVWPGDRVALMLPNVPAFPIAFYGALAAGSIVVPMDPLLKSREIAYHLSDSGASVLLAWHAAADEVALGAAGTGVRVLKVDDPDAAGLGQEVGAAVQLKPAVTVTPEELRAFVKNRVAPYKYPRHVWIVPDLLKGPTAKILRRAVHHPRTSGNCHHGRPSSHPGERRSRTRSSAAPVQCPPRRHRMLRQGPGSTLPRPCHHPP